MPYIIETRQPLALRGRWGEDIEDWRVSRVAVTTLDEAREQARQASIMSEHDYSGGTWEADYAPFEAQCESLPESGGTIGPLPDGTLIEVHPVGVHVLRAASGLPMHGSASFTADEILEAFNASA